MTNEIGAKVIDGREALAVIVIRESAEGDAIAEIKSLTIDKLSMANLLKGLAEQLEALHESESDDSGMTADTDPALDEYRDTIAFLRENAAELGLGSDISGPADHG